MFLKQKRPRGAYPTLPGAIDEVMKAHCDEARKTGLVPPQLKSFIGSHVLLEDQKAIDRMRFWKEGLTTTVERTIDYDGKAITHSYFIQGSIDDLLFDPDTDTFAIPDFKTRRSDPEPGYSEKYYQTSMDCYAFLLQEMGLEPNGQAFLWYMWPIEVHEPFPEKEIHFKFGSSVQVLHVDADKIGKMLDEIAEITPKDDILEKNWKPKRPSPNPDCEYCNYKRIQ